jgi:competence protein ComEC
MVGVTLAALGGARTAIDLQPSPADVGTLLPPQANIDGVTLMGWVDGAAEHTPRGARFTLQADTLVVRADSLAVEGTVQVFLRPSLWDTTAVFPTVRQGDRLRLDGTLRAPPDRRNPADFDYGAYLRRQGIHALLHVEAPDHVAILQQRSGIGKAVVEARHYVASQIDQHVRGQEPRGVLRALLVGDRGTISASTQQQFATTGLLHLLAISGLHVLIVGMTVYQLLRPALIRWNLSWQYTEWIRTAITIGLLVFFALLTGGRPSVVRAVVMAALFIGANTLQRTTQSLNTLGVAALGLLVYRPLALFDVGFQLSFSAVAAIVALNPRLQLLLPPAWRHHGWRGQIGSLITVSVGATLGTAPVLLTHFGYVSAAGVVLNVVAIPLTALALLSGLCTALMGGGMVAASFGAAAEIMTVGLMRLAAAGTASLGWASIDATVRDPLVVLALIAGMLVIVHGRHARRRWLLTGVTLLLVTAHVWKGVLATRPPPSLDVIFFDVGQGDAALVAFPNGRHFLIDTGPRSPYGDAGASVVIPHLRRYGIDRLDAVLISHSDSDHLGGLPSILRYIPVDRLIMNDPLERSGLVDEVDMLIDSLGVPQRAVHAGDTLLMDQSTLVHILGPVSAGPPTTRDRNDASILTQLTYGEHQFLLLGDVEEGGEWRAAQLYSDLLESEVIKVPHHGSATSSTQVLVERAAVEDGLAVISASQRNPFGHPHRDVVKRWQEAGAEVLATSVEGAVWVRSNGEAIERIAWREHWHYARD